MDELEAHEQQVAFEKKYMLRSEYKRDLELARHGGRVEAAIFCVFILPVILICAFLLLKTIGLIRPGDFGM